MREGQSCWERFKTRLPWADPRVSSRVFCLYLNQFCFDLVGLLPVAVVHVTSDVDAFPEDEALFREAHGHDRFNILAIAPAAGRYDGVSAHRNLVHGRRE